MTSGLYIHIPFCVKKCNYCDFYSIGGGNTVPDEYIDAVIREIKKYPDIKWKTVYFGGGTPSLLTPQQAERILSQLDIVPDAEITLEANPETVTLDKLQGFRKAGINRLSFGVQTAKQNSLETLGRIHSNQKVTEAFEAAKTAVDDMMNEIMGILACCIDGQDPATCTPQQEHHCGGSCDSCGGCH